MFFRKDEIFLGGFLRVCFLGLFMCHVSCVLCHILFAEEISKICFQKHCFSVEIAQTEEQRMKGLMFRENFPEDAGMLFIFDEPGMHGFWMKNTLIPLDMIWLDDDMRVVYIEENALPCKEEPCPVYFSGSSARYVLELNAGIARKIGLKVQDCVQIADQ